MKIHIAAILSVSAVIFACEHRATAPDDSGTVQNSANLSGGGGQADSANSGGGGGNNGGNNGGGQADSTSMPPVTHGPVASVAVTRAPLPGNRAVAVNDSLGFTADVKDAAGNQLYEKAPTFTTSNSAVVRIDWSGGRFAIGKAVAAGTATVTATADGKSGSVSVTVN